MADLILVKSADPNKADKTGWTPLHWPARKGHLPVADLLLVKGADPNKADKKGNAPLCVAADQGHLPVVELLKRAEAGESGKFPGPGCHPARDI